MEIQAGENEAPSDKINLKQKKKPLSSTPGVSLTNDEIIPFSIEDVNKMDIMEVKNQMFKQAMRKKNGNRDQARLYSDHLDILLRNTLEELEREKFKTSKLQEENAKLYKELSKIQTDQSLLQSPIVKNMPEPTPSETTSTIASEDNLLTKPIKNLTYEHAQEAIENGRNFQSIYQFTERFITVKCTKKSEAIGDLLRALKAYYDNLEIAHQHISNLNNTLQQDFDAANQAKYTPPTNTNILYTSTTSDSTELLTDMKNKIAALTKELNHRDDTMLKLSKQYEYIKENYEYNLQEITRKNEEIALFADMYRSLKQTLETNEKLATALLATTKKQKTDMPIHSYADAAKSATAKDQGLHVSALLIKKTTEISEPQLRNALYKETKNDPQLKNIKCYLARDKQTFIFKDPEERNLTSLSDKIQQSDIMNQISELQLKTTNKKKLIILGIPTEMEEATVTAKIQDILNTKTAITVPKIIQRQGTNIYQMVIELDSSAAAVLLSEGRILFQFHTCRVAPYTPVIRCTNCQWYGHNAKSCTYEVTCTCCGKPHTTEQCKVAENTAKHRCVNCIARNYGNVQHMASSNQCRVYREQLIKRNRSTNFPLRST